MSYLKPKSLLGLLGGLLLVSPTVVFAQPMLELVEDRGHYLIMNDAQQLFETTFPNNWQEYQPVLRAIEDGYLAVHRDNSRILITITVPPIQMGGYHRPLANRVHGIGHAHWDTPPFRTINAPGYYDNEGIWDGTPRSSLQGIAYLGQWSFFTETSDPDTGFLLDRMESYMSHEVGHSWLAFPWFRGDDGQPRRTLLDWEETHWSIYADTGSRMPDGSEGRSPLGGHSWRELESGVFATTIEPLAETLPNVFSDLDLYLMGVLPPEQVEPFLVIENPTACRLGDEPITCADPLHADLIIPGTLLPSEPVDYKVEGQGRRVTIEDIIAVEGPRIPAFGEAPIELPVTFVVIKRPETTLSEEDKLVIERLVQRLIEVWNDLTRGLFPMVNRSSLDDSTPGIGAFTCVEDNNTMCLLDGRFQVTVHWRDFQEGTGLGRVVQHGTNNSGLFWFFDVENWEVMLKVLDGCALNDHLWVFAAATTNVEYTLTVTDSTTGESRRYHNPLGRRAAATTDTAAFPCR